MRATRARRAKRGYELVDPEIRAQAEHADMELDDDDDEYLDDLDDRNTSDELEGLQLDLGNDDSNGDDEFIYTNEFNGNGESAYDDLDSDYDIRDAMRSAGNFRPKNKKSKASMSAWKRKMMRSENRELDPEVKHFLSQANEAFVQNQLERAQHLYLEVIKKDPKNFSAYQTLGEICKTQHKYHECCNYWLLAANLHPWDSHFWGTVAELSADLGHVDQAIYCYSRAIASDTAVNLVFVRERALLYQKKRQYGRALEGLQKVHQAYPADRRIIKHLASVYVDQKRISDAINLYLNILDQNQHPKSADAIYPKFKWVELNILCELYMQQHSWKSGVRIVKLVARWKQDRQDEKWWDDVDNDAEFDARRFDVLAGMPKAKSTASTKQHFLPIDIRYKLGVFRLKLDQKDEALRHFEFLLEEESGVSDLLFSAGKELETHGYYSDALLYLTSAASSFAKDAREAREQAREEARRAHEASGISDEFFEFNDDNEDPDVDIELVTLLAKCYLEVGDYHQARDIYTMLANATPSDLHIKLALAETLYHLGETENSQRLLTEVSSARKKMLLSPSPEESQVDSEDINDNLSLIKSKQALKSSKGQKLSDEEKLEIENNAKRKVLEKHRRMERLEEALHKGDAVAIDAWMQLADQLVEAFMSVPSFFPRDKNRTFKGIVAYRRKKPLEIDERLARVYNLYEGISSGETYTRAYLTSRTEYRGLKYDDWFMIFVQYALLLARTKNDLEYAVHIVEVAMDVSVFVQDRVKEGILRLVRLTFAITQEDYMTALMSHVRYFLVSNQFSSFIFKFFLCCFASGTGAWDAFANYNHQKFFLRQLKAYDSIISNKKITGMATITADVKDVHLGKEHAELLYIYSNLLGGNRNYTSPVVYLNRAYKEYNKDPSICLTLGLAHVHRSMQRLSANRHIQLLQGISYIMEYRGLRLINATVYEQQEVEFNMGRLFHMIGLTSEAVKHYNKVLEFHEALSHDPDYDLAKEAAYNLGLIYNINGNAQLARKLTLQYLSI